MGWIDRIERIARVVLWLSLASAVLIAPVSYIRARREEGERAEAARKEAQAAEEAMRKEKQAAEAAEKMAKPLSLATMGTYLVALDTAGATGSLFFSNVSPRSGVVCVEGVAENPTTMGVSTSLPACHEVAAYGSAVHVSLMFAGGELKNVCPAQGACRLKVKDAQSM